MTSNMASNVSTVIPAVIVIMIGLYFSYCPLYTILEPIRVEQSPNKYPEFFILQSKCRNNLTDCNEMNTSGLCCYHKATYYTVFLQREIVHGKIRQQSSIFSMEKIIDIKDEYVEYDAEKQNQYLKLEKYKVGESVRLYKFLNHYQLQDELFYVPTFALVEFLIITIAVLAYSKNMEIEARNMMVTRKRTRRRRRNRK